MKIPAQILRSLRGEFDAARFSASAQHWKHTAASVVETKAESILPSLHEGDIARALRLGREVAHLEASYSKGSAWQNFRTTLEAACEPFCADLNAKEKYTQALATQRQRQHALLARLLGLVNEASVRLERAASELPGWSARLNKCLADAEMAYVRVQHWPTLPTFPELDAAPESVSRPLLSRTGDVAQPARLRTPPTRCRGNRASSPVATRAKDLSGKRFGRLEVLGPVLTGLAPHGNSYWRCRCDCGVLREVLGRNLRHGQAKSCGCLRRENLSAPGAQEKRLASHLANGKKGKAERRAFWEILSKGSRAEIETSAARLRELGLAPLVVGTLDAQSARLLGSPDNTTEMIERRQWALSVLRRAEPLQQRIQGEISDLVRTWRQTPAGGEREEVAA